MELLRILSEGEDFYELYKHNNYPKKRSSEIKIMLSVNSRALLSSKAACKESRVRQPGLVDFAIGLVNSVLNLPDGQEKIFLRSKITEVL